MDSLLADLRQGLRLMRKTPLFAAVTIVTLALGIGANTAVFSTVDAALVRALPFHDPDRVVMVWEDASFAGFPRNTPAPANYLDWKSRNRVFTDMAASRFSSSNLTGDGPPELVAGRAVTANFFDVLGVRPLVGRMFSEDEDRTAAPVVVLSYELWHRRYAADRAMVGRAILMDGLRRTVTGVMPRAFVFRNREVDYWLPISFSPADMVTRSSHYLNVMARLANGVPLERSRQEMRGLAAQLAAEHRDTNARIGAVVVPIKEDTLWTTRVQLLVLMGGAACVLLIACANLASFLLSRSFGPRAEMAVRTALGATRSRLVRQMVVEGTVLALLGGALGLAVASVGMKALTRLIPVGLHELSTSALDRRLLVFTVVLSVATGLIFSLAPAVQAAWSSPNEALQQAGRSSVGGRSRFTRDALVVAQIAVALVLLVGAGLMVRTLANLRSIDVGFRSDHLLTLRTTLPREKYRDPVKRLEFYERVIDGVRRLPGVESAAYGFTLPFLSRGNTTGYRIEGQNLPEGDPGDAMFRVGTDDYLKTLGVQLVEGRLTDARDRAGAPRAMVVNQTLARRYWPRQSALGHRLRLGDAAAPTAPWWTIVGVVQDVRERGFELEMKPGVYLPYAQLGETWGLPENLLVRTMTDPLSMAAAVRPIVSGVDPDQPISLVRTMDDIVNLELANRQQQTALLGAFAVLALMLASLGLYGVLSYAVTQRSREIGLRMALGATAGAVMRLIVGRGVALTGLGLAIGLGLAWAATRAMNNLLYGVAATDPSTFGAVAAVLMTVALAACSVPALRAARVDPMRVLREE